MQSLFSYNDRNVYRIRQNGDIRFISFDDLKDNVQSGTAYNRQYREITKNEYRFENFAQRNIIKFNNSDDVGYVAQGELTVNDLTLEKERDMYVIKFDLAEQSADGKAEFILYKQRVTETEKGGKIETGFENNYSENRAFVFTMIMVWQRYYRYCQIV